jgi:3-deoxy-manno-octulosonate cytidylyltransferase (CMP-KDO synthetase)|tara:strand:+ start:1550 stop:2311 length:762 start_codon:yes stop_codon:yes gene_type:complete
MDFKVIIPARAESKRLPGKVLLDINGKPMLQYVYDVAVASGARDVVIATDNEEIAETAKNFGAEVCMTDTDHVTGTERISEAVSILGYDDEDIIVNVQGDEPLLPPSAIAAVASDLDMHDSAKVSTICTQIKDEEELFNPNVVKVVCNHRGFAMYFSRAPIPWERESFALEPKKMLTPHYRHIGLYAYRAGYLAQYIKITSTAVEQAESLEQLRMLMHGHRIHLVVTDDTIHPSVDTSEDFQKVKEIMKSMQK